MIKRRRKSGRGASTGFLLVVLVICVVIFVTYWNGRGVGDDTIVGIINEKPTRVQDLVRDWIHPERTLLLKRRFLF